MNFEVREGTVFEAEIKHPYNMIFEVGTLFIAVHTKDHTTQILRQCVHINQGACIVTCVE